jgi:iron complex transport system substrate-binding protein
VSPAVYIRPALAAAAIWATPAGASGFPVTIDNCGVAERVEKAPARAVSNDVNITETMLALGLQGQMAGCSGIDALDEVTAPLRPRLDGIPRLARNYPSLEILLAARADFYVAGWDYGLQVGGEMTPENLARHGIGSYAIRESCIRLGPRPAIGLVDLYEDLLALGQIFGAAERATNLVEELQKRVATVASRVVSAPAVPIFVYDSGDDAPLTAGGQAMPTALIAAAGGRNVVADLANSWTTVSWETLVAGDPAVIVIVDYPPTTAAQKIDMLKHMPSLAGVTAVRTGRFVAIPYAVATPGIRNIDAVETLARALHPELAW